jgi:hypothetical protein
MYIIVRDPLDTSDESSLSPRKVFNSLEQAEAVIKKMASQYKKTYYIAKLIKRTVNIEVKIEDV